MPLSLQIAAVERGKSFTNQLSGQCVSLGQTGRIQRDIRLSLVTTPQVPICLPMTDQPEFCHLLSNPVYFFRKPVIPTTINPSTQTDTNPIPNNRPIPVPSGTRDEIHRVGVAERVMVGVLVSVGPGVRVLGIRDDVGVRVIVSRVAVMVGVCVAGEPLRMINF